MKYPKTFRLLLLLTLMMPLFYFLYEPGQDPTANHDAKSEDTLQASSETLDEELSPIEQIKKRLASAKTLEEFLRILKESLLNDELSTIQALAEMESKYLEENYPITQLLKEYFAERYTALDTIDRVAALKDTKYNIYKSLAVEMLAWHADKDDPQALVDYLNDPETYDISSLIPASVAYHVVRHDIPQALDFIEQINDKGMQADFREAVFQHWASTSPQETAEYLSSIERGPEYDLPVYSLASMLDHRHHDVAMEWAGEIHDPKLQRQTYEDVAAAWYLNPDAPDRERYAKWKSTVTDPDLLQQLEQQEGEHEERSYIKESFQDSIDSISAILRENEENGTPTDGLDGELDKLVELATEVIHLANAHPDDSLLYQEAFILKERIANEFPKLGELHPDFKDLISTFRKEEQERIQRENLGDELSLNSTAQVETN